VDGMSAATAATTSPLPADAPAHSPFSPLSRALGLILSRSLSCIRSDRSRTAIAIGAFELLPGRSSPTSAPFFDSFFLEFRFHTTVVERTS